MSLKSLIQIIILCLWMCHTPCTAFGDKVICMTLEDAISLALRANRNLCRSAAGLESQRLSLSSAWSEFDVKLRPSADAGYSDDTESFGAGLSLEKKFDTGVRASLDPNIGKSDGLYSGKIGISLSIPLLRGLGRKANLNAADRSEFAVRTGKRSLYLTRKNVVLDTVSAVYEIVRQKEMVRIFKSQARRLKAYAKTAQVREKVGLATPLDVYRAEIRLKDVEDSLTLARESLRNGEDQLKLILAMPMEKPVEISAPLEFEMIQMPLNKAVAIALEHRIELEQAEDEIRETRRRSDVARHNILPQLDLEFDYGRHSTSEHFGGTMDLNEDRWSLRLVSNTDMARTSEKTAFRQSLISIRTARLNLEAKQAEIQREVRRQLEAMIKAEERIRIREEQIKQARGKLALAKIKFNHAMADNSDIIEAETEIQNAEVSLLSVNTKYIVGTYQLRAVLGTLIETTNYTNHTNKQGGSDHELHESHE